MIPVWFIDLWAPSLIALVIWFWWHTKPRSPESTTKPTKQELIDAINTPEAQRKIHGG